MAAAGWGLYNYEGRPARVIPSSPHPVSSLLVPEERKALVTLYLPAAGVEGLTEEKKEIPDSSSFADKADQILQELLMGDAETGQSLFPRGTKVRGVYEDARGVVYVDLSQEATQGARLGPWDEALRVYSVVDTLAANFPELKRVKVLVEGQEVDSLAGYISLQSPLTPRPDLIQPPPGTTDVPPRNP